MSEDFPCPTWATTATSSPHSTVNVISRSTISSLRVFAFWWNSNCLDGFGVTHENVPCSMRIAGPLSLSTGGCHRREINDRDYPMYNTSFIDWAKQNRSRRKQRPNVIVAITTFSNHCRNCFQYQSAFWAKTLINDRTKAPSHQTAKDVFYW